MSGSFSRWPILRLGVLILTVVVGLGGVAAASRAPHTIPAPRSTPHHPFEAPLPQAGTTLPVFLFDTPQVVEQSTFALAQQFSGIYQRQNVAQDKLAGHLRYTMANTQTNSLLEQYTATGGFYAYNAHEAFSETPRGPLDPGQAQLLACQFLLQSQLLPTNVITPATNNCNPQTPPLYTVNLAHATGQSIGGTQGPDQVISAIVQVPMAINIGALTNVVTIPLSGPGGHISLLFRTTGQDTGFSLDSSVPGLGAVAMPFYSRTFNKLKDVPIQDPTQVHDQVVQQLRLAYPDAQNIQVPTPALVYNVNDASTPQTALEPDFSFEGAQVTDHSGNTLVVKSFIVPATVPGPSGFGPSVVITAPTNGSPFAPGANVTLTGMISDGAAPYSYQWTTEDGTVLQDSTANTAGSVSLTTNALPAINHAGIAEPTVVHLHVVDANGAIREALVSLQSGQAAYLPLVLRATANLPTAGVLAPVTPQHVAPASANYSFGTEQASDYPPYGPGGPDLGGVPPDINGFRSELAGAGWSPSFAWANASAWEKDWRDCGLGGGDCSYGVDRVDFAYYSGHGNNGGIYMPSSVDQPWFSGTQARYSRLRWVGFSSCLTLRAQWSPASAAPIRDWFNAFQGVHMLLGFNSVMGDIAFGGPLIDNMRMPTFFGIPFPWAQRTIREAWVQTAFDMNAGKPAYIYAIGTNGVNPVDDKLPQGNDPAPQPPAFPIASWNWVWWDE